ncbi:hypothetical protein LCGC14_2187190 [marine sediment metagenome]|uniref:Uncharacterized protein n=1 Tax=marine sediment metagenome TaxID=412755 RepID=A0A0F9DKJ1_9ZZZZ
MKLIDIDNQEGHNLSKEAETYLKNEYPEDEFGDMYDLQGDMCLDEDEYENIEIELAQRGFLGQI